MLTYLPYADLRASVHALADAELGLQRVVARGILGCLRGRDSEELAHEPGVRMWAGYERTLAWLGMASCLEWRSRGRLDSLASYFLGALREIPAEQPSPEWLGWETLHRSHRSLLLREGSDAARYRAAFGADLPDDLPLVFPKERV